MLLKSIAKCLPYALTAEVAWDILDEHNTKYSCAVQMWIINYVHDALSTKTVLAGSCQTNERWKNLQRYSLGELTAGKRNIDVPSYVTKICANET